MRIKQSLENIEITPEMIDRVMEFVTDGEIPIFLDERDGFYCSKDTARKILEVAFSCASGLHGRSP